MAKDITGRPVHWDMVRRVGELRTGENPPSFNAIARQMTREVGKKVHVRSVERWYKRVPELH